MRTGKNLTREQKTALTIMSLALLVVSIEAGIYAAGTLRKYRRLSRENEILLAEYVRPTSREDENMGIKEDEEPDDLVYEEPPEDISVCPIEVDFAGLLEQNGDIAGWIYIEDTQINYPIAQGTDNYYYLTHNINGTDTGYGMPFMDAGCSPALSCANTILYGHHMNDGSMFASVVKFRKQDFLDEHGIMWYLTPEHTYRVRLYSCYVTEADSAAYNVRFGNSSDYADWLKETIRLSDVQADFTPNITDRILTLSTCSYEFRDARTVLHGVLEEIAQINKNDPGSMHQRD